VDEINTESQFHQPIGAKHKCAQTGCLAQSVSPTKLYPTLPAYTTRSHAQLLCFNLYARHVKLAARGQHSAPFCATQIGI